MKAKRLIFVHMNGAMSQHDTFEYKPQLFKDGGKPGPGGGTLTAPKFQFARHGDTGSRFSELLPNLAKHADELCWLRGRPSEAGVRFVEICQPGRDHHNNLHKGLLDRCGSVDRPTAALLADLEGRGLLDDTLVLFGSKFGRLPTAQGVDGRDHYIPVRGPRLPPDRREGDRGEGHLRVTRARFGFSPGRRRCRTSLSARRRGGPTPTR